MLASATASGGPCSVTFDVRARLPSRVLASPGARPLVPGVAAPLRLSPRGIEHAALQNTCPRSQQRQITVRPWQRPQLNKRSDSELGRATANLRALSKIGLRPRDASSPPHRARPPRRAGRFEGRELQLPAFTLLGATLRYRLRWFGSKILAEHGPRLAPPVARRLTHLRRLARKIPRFLVVVDRCLRGGTVIMRLRLP